MQSIIPSPLLFWEMTGKPHNPWSLTNNEMAIAEGIICKSLTWNLNCFPLLPTEAMLYIVATHKSLLYFGLHFLLPSQDTYIITSIFSCINSTSSSQHGPFHQHLCSYKNKANLPSPPSYPSICCPLSFHITVKFSKTVGYSFSLFPHLPPALRHIPILLMVTTY